MYDELFRLHCLYEHDACVPASEYNGMRLILYNDGSGMVGGTKVETGEAEWIVFDWDTPEEGIAVLKKALRKRGIEA